jgi:hypothetical protein
MPEDKTLHNHRCDNLIFYTFRQIGIVTGYGLDGGGVGV